MKKKRKRPRPAPPPPRRGKPFTPPDLSTARGRLGDAIRTARLARGISGSSAAEEIGVSSRTWYNWEEGRNFPPLDTLSALADVLGCTIGDLIPEGP